MAEIRRILFPTDFSDYSNKAVPYAASLAEKFNAKLILLHISEYLEDDSANPEHSFAPLRNMVGTAETERVTIRGHAAYKHILELSRAKNCDLIVMATHGRSALSQFFLGGSVAEEVARFSSIPVFIVKVEPDSPPETYTGRLREVLFATDFSKGAATAFPHAAYFARTFGAKLYALHVVDESLAEVYKANGLDQTDSGFQGKVEEFLRRHISAWPGSDLVSSYHVNEGRADAEIVKFAEAVDIDLVAIATKGHNLVEEELLGTTADHVIRKAHCPVLTVRG